MMRFPEQAVDQLQDRGGAGRDRLVREPGLEVIGEFVGSLVAQFRGFLQAFEGDHFQLGISRRIEHSRSDRLLLEDLQQKIDRRRRLEWGTPRQALVENCTQAVDIAAGTDPGIAAGGLFGRHVTRGSHDDPRAGQQFRTIRLPGLFGQQSLQQLP